MQEVCVRTMDFSSHAQCSKHCYVMITVKIVVTDMVFSKCRNEPCNNVNDDNVA